MKRRLLISLLGIVVISLVGLITNLSLGNKPLLGLDLQGGSHVLLEIDRAELVRSQVTQLRDDVRRILREDFAELRRSGRDHPGMARIEKLFLSGKP